MERTIRLVSTDKVNSIVSVTEAKSHLAVRGSRNDALIQTFVSGSKKTLESYLSRKLDDCTYSVIFDIQGNRPAIEDRLWLGVAPVTGVAYKGDKLDVYGDFNRYVKFNAAMEGEDKITLSVTVQWGDYLDGIKVPAMTIINDFYNNRAYTKGVAYNVNETISAALMSYRRIS